MIAKKILVVDDERPLAEALKAKLETKGHSVTAVTNGDDALGELRRGTYDLVVLDILMPGANGFDVLGSMMAKDNPTPVVVASNVSDEEEVEKAMKLGAKDYLVKSEHTLEEIIEKVLQYV